MCFVEELLPVFLPSSITYFHYLYMCMYIRCGYNGKPSPLYKLPTCPANVKIEDALVCDVHPVCMGRGGVIMHSIIFTLILASFE